jgi:hypothetical protein
MIKLYKALADQLKGYDAVPTPTMPTSHIPADWDPTIADAQLIDGKRKFHRMIGALYTIPFNFLNTFPDADRRQALRYKDRLSRSTCL